MPGLGAFPGQGVAPPGRARIRPGAPSLCGALSLRPHRWFPRAFLEGGVWAVGAWRVGFASERLRPGLAPFPGSFVSHTSILLHPASAGMCVGVMGVGGGEGWAAGRGNKGSRNGYQPWSPR